MRYSKVFIDSIGYELPPVVVSTSELEDRVSSLFEKLHIPEGQLEEWTGIYERRWWDPDFELSVGASSAGIKAMEKCNVTPDDIEMLVYTGVCRENFEPATACRVADTLGIRKDSMIFDISNACLGVLNGIIEVANHIELGHIKAGMVVSAESSREINEITIEKMLHYGTMDFFIASLAVLTGGSGAVAVVITDGSFGESKRKLTGASYFAAPEFHDICKWGMEYVQGYLQRMFMETDSTYVLKKGVELATKTWKKFLDTTGWNIEDIGKTICHQVGSAHRDTLLKALSIPKDKDFITYPFLGNIGTVSLPISAAIAEERGLLSDGMKTALMGIGSGLNCMMLGLEW